MESEKTGKTGMSEKLYRIKPLVWRESPSTLNAWNTKAPMGAFYSVWPEFPKVSGGYSSSLPGSPSFDTEHEAMEACQSDYEQRLLAAGVVEEVS